MDFVDKEVKGSVKMSSRPQREPIILLSGGFDPLHVGHVRMMEAARAHGRVIVALNSDEWLLRKKGYVFMPWKERGEIITGLRCVYKVMSFDDQDGTACDAIRKVKPDYFGNGGDRIQGNTPETALCDEIGVDLLWNLGGERIQSSSELVALAEAGNLEG